MVQLLLLPPRPRQSLDEHAIDATALCGYDSEMVDRQTLGNRRTERPLVIHDQQMFLIFRHLEERRYSDTWGGTEQPANG